MGLKGKPGFHLKEGVEGETQVSPLGFPSFFFAIYICSVVPSLLYPWDLQEKTNMLDVPLAEVLLK
jgi:hypothetical protein